MFQGQFLCIACFWSPSCSVILMKAWRSVWQTQFIFSSHKSEFFILSWCFNHLKVVGSNEEDKLSKSTHTDALPQDWHPRHRPRDRWRGHKAELPQPLILRPGPTLSARCFPALRIHRPIIVDQNLFSCLKIVNLRGSLWLNCLISRWITRQSSHKTFASPCSSSSAWSRSPRPSPGPRGRCSAPAWATLISELANYICDPLWVATWDPDINNPGLWPLLEVVITHQLPNFTWLQSTLNWG